MNIRRSLDIASVLLLLLCVSSPITVFAQETSAQATPPGVLRLNKLVDTLDKKISSRASVRNSIIAGTTTAADGQKELEELNSDIDSLSETFELLTVGDFDDGLFKDKQDEPFDWKVELMLVLEPLIDSLQSLTEKPRQMNALRTTIALNKERLAVSEQAIVNLATLAVDSYEQDTRVQIEQFQSKWLDQRESFEQRLLSAQAHLDRLERLEASNEQGFMPTARGFILGRGLTLLLAVFAAAAAWFVIRLLWGFFSTHMVSKEQRRSSLWFRLLSYSMYLVNIIVCIAALMIVLYIREDLLLLALALLLMVVATIGIRRYIPAYVREARLLLDLGSVREGERVMYNSLPWQVMSINLHTVLWNPALEGIVRLPLETIETLTSRPVKDKTWFPTKKGDYILLPDTTFAEVLGQTPELVQLRIRGGMIQWVPTADFYAMNIINLSAGKTYGVATTFGFDYSLQSISLTDIPRTLKESITAALNEQGFEKFIDGLMVELKAASASSIDYLIYVTVKSEKASDFFRIERIVQQTCIAVANQKGWNIPFPQMMIHYDSAATA